MASLPRAVPPALFFLFVGALAGDTTWSPTGSMAALRRDHAATLLPSGKVLITGHLTSGAELYDPAKGTFASVGSTVYAHGQKLTATLLADGRVLLVGGFQAPRSAEVYDPISGNFTALPTPLTPHYGHTATLLKNGRVLIAGGIDSSGSQAAAGVYDPAQNSFSKTGSMTTARGNHTASLMADGRVLIAGGDQSTGTGQGTVLRSAELYDPAADRCTLTSAMRTQRTGHYA